MSAQVTPIVSVSDRFLQLAAEMNITTIYDCGSRDAADGVYLLSQLPARELHVFECNPEAIQRCRDTIKAYRGPGTIVLNAVALADKVGETTFLAIDPKRTVTTWADGNIGASSLFKANPAFPDEKYVQVPLTVPTTTLNEYVKTHSGPDLLWMDLQGAELMVLQAGAKAIPSVKLIQLEVGFRPVYLGQGLFWGVHRQLQAYGFRLFSITNISRLSRWLRVPRWAAVGAWFGDAIYVRKP